MTDNGADIINYRDLAACDPADVTSRTHASYDDRLEQYTVTIWNERFVVDLKQNCIACLDEDLRFGGGLFDLFVLYYLMTSKKLSPEGEWVSEKDIPGGAGFFRGPHTIPGDVLVKKVQNDLELFSKTCIKAGGKPVDMGDKAFVFQITPTIPVVVLYWAGDEDFPAEAKLLFDRTIQEHFALDIIFGLAVEVCWRLSRIAKKLSD